ncbi:MAG: hypothetical protein ACYCYE_12915 [Clostridia bacterium]
MLIEIIQKLNNDKSVSGILLLRPMPKNIDERVLNKFCHIQRMLTVLLILMKRNSKKGYLFFKSCAR